MLYDYQHYLDLLQEHIDSPTKSKKRNVKKNRKKKYIIKKKKCCVKQLLIKNTCQNCGRVFETLEIEECEDINIPDKNYDEINKFVVSGYSKSFPSIQRLSKWNAITYDTRTLTLEIKPLIKSILNNINIYDEKMIYKVYLTYKNYFESSNIRRRGKVKISLIILMIFIIFTHYEEKNGFNLNYKLLLKQNGIIKTNISYLNKNIEKDYRFFIVKLLKILK